MSVDLTKYSIFKYRSKINKKIQNAKIALYVLNGIKKVIFAINKNFLLFSFVSLQRITD